MQSRVLITICILLVTVTVAQSRRWFAPELSCWITQEKVPASWEDAQSSCEIEGAVLASPLTLQLFNYMQTLINMNNHSAAYFLGTRVNHSSDSQKVHHVSIEGRRLDDMPGAVYDAIDQLDLEQGDCLSMDRHGIRAVSCWDHLPYICYSNGTAESGIALGKITSTSPASTTTSTSTITSTPTTTTASPTSTIPPGYKYYSATGSYYKVYLEGQVTWHVANSTCASEGARLLVVNDANEADLIARIANGGGWHWIWTGLLYTRQGRVMEWRTVNREPLSAVFRKWSEGRPLNDAGHACAYFRTLYKEIYDEPCDNQNAHVVCEISQ